MQYSILESWIQSKTPCHSFWQSQLWREILTRSEQASEVFYFWDVSGSYILVEIRSIWLGQYAGFSLWVWPSQISDDFEAFFHELSRILQEKGCIFYQIEPIEYSNHSESGLYTYLSGRTSSSHYRSFLTPHTRLLDISVSEDQILKQMHEKGRYNIRLAEKRWVKIEEVIPSTENIDIWMELLHETTSRDGFSHNSRHYYEAFLQELDSHSSGGLIFAYYEWVVIAAIIIVYQPTQAIYYYWASKSSKELRKHMAPYLLQWHALCESKKRGILLYDFLWIADPNNKSDPLRSVSDFKEKFGGYVAVLPRKFTLALSFKWMIFLFIYSLFRK